MARNNIAAVEETVEIVDSNETERIPAVLSEQSILGHFCEQYLSTVDEIAEYNKTVTAEKSSDWTGSKVIAEARKLGNPEDANIPANEDIKKAIDVWEELATQVALARKNVIQLTSDVLGISLSAVAERDPEKEAALKEKRSHANEIGTQLVSIAKLSVTTNSDASEAVTEFLKANPLPAVGRDSVRTFGDTEAVTTPKYRVNVTVSRDGVELFTKSGFSQTALALTKYYPRGESLKADVLRKLWEDAGNTVENTVKPVVEFEDNDLMFTITKK